MMKKTTTAPSTALRQARRFVTAPFRVNDQWRVSAQYTNLDGATFTFPTRKDALGFRADAVKKIADTIASGGFYS
jgi:hypothetical protein